MAAAATATEVEGQAATIDLLGSKHHTTHDKPALVFCNGIMNSEANARLSAQKISIAFEGRPVFFKYNPANLGSVTTPDDDELHRQAEFVDSFAQDLLRYLDKQPDRRIILFAHSHGALVTQQTMAKSEMEGVKKQIKIHAFGGAALLARNTASLVINYTFSADPVPALAEARFSQDNPFYLMNLVNITKSQRYTTPSPKGPQHELEQAIFWRAYVDLGHHLTRSDRTADDRKDYQKFFTEENLEGIQYNVYFATRFANYTKLFDEYSVVFCTSTKFVHPEYASVATAPTWGEAISNLGANIAQFAQEAAAHASENHSFNKYASLLPVISELDDPDG